MSRLIVSLAIILALIVAAMIFLAGRASEQPQTRMEEAVSLANLQ